MSAISRCGAGAVVAGACIAAAVSGGPSHVVLCAPTPQTRADGSVGTAYQVTTDQLSQLPYAGWTPANYVEGLGATCDPVPPGYVLEPGVLTNSSGDEVDEATALAQHKVGGMLDDQYPVYEKA